MLRFVNFYADRRQTTDKPIALPLAAHARTWGTVLNLILRMPKKVSILKNVRLSGKGRQSLHI